MTTVSAATTLSAQLRARTHAAHERAESAPFVTRLLGGELPLSAYVRLVAQNHAIYSALEAVAEQWRGDPVAGPFVLDELTRLPALEADLDELLGTGWRGRAESLRLPSTDRYVQRLHESAADRPAGFVAHHYVRYLGDLSGGQVVNARIRQVYGDDGARATSFYRFPAIERIPAFRERYRGLLDAAPFPPDEQQRVVAEAVRAFELNHSVFVDLASAVG